jgi:hypothetical protein
MNVEKGKFTELERMDGEPKERLKMRWEKTAMQRG